MSDTNLPLALAKVIISIAWADGNISPDEINCLKDLIFQFSHSSERKMGFSMHEWAMLEMYIEAPVDAVERSRLLEDLWSIRWTSTDKVLALSALENMIRADGVVTEEEQVVIAEIKAAIKGKNRLMSGQLGHLIRGPIQRRLQAVNNAPNRDEYFEDYIKNKVYYRASRRLKLGAVKLDIPDTNLRKLSLAGGLMAQVAHVDLVVTDDEFNVMVNALERNWSINRDASTLVAEVAVSEISTGLDFYRLTRSFLQCTTEAERLHFLDILFAVADADGYVSFDETEEIRRIAKGLFLTHKQFIHSKLRIPQERRAA